MSALLELQDLSVGLRSGVILVDGVSLRVDAGQALGLVGESGSGKSLTAFAVMRMFPSVDVVIRGGRLLLDGRDLRALGPAAMRRVRGAEIGMVYQDPSAYLDPLMSIGDQIAEAPRIHRRPVSVEALLEMVELPPALARRHPHQLSGGQRQRVLIAAALALRPRLLIADEPTTALDATVQAEILDLLQRLQAALGLGVLLISHDLAVVAQRCTRVAVMYAGRVVEDGPAAALFATPRHPYTQGLVRSTLATEADAARLFSIPGRVPSPVAMPLGCAFHPRCPAAIDRCRAERPPLTQHGPDRADSCWRSAPGWDAWPAHD